MFLNRELFELTKKFINIRIIILLFLLLTFINYLKAQNKMPIICAGQSVTICLDSFYTPESFCNYPQIPSNLKNGLLGYWPFCGNANDVSGNGNHGLVFGSSLTTDRFGNPNSAYYFNGTGNYIVCPGGNSFTAQKLTISYWININNYSSTSEIICLGNASSTYWGTVSSNSGTGLDYGTGCGAITTTAKPPTFYNPNQWYNVVLVSDKFVQNTAVYINGQFIGNNSISPTVGCQTSNIYFGVDIFSNPEYFTGKLDDIQIWDRLLSSSEIMDVYSEGTSDSWLNGPNSNCITVTPSQTTYYYYTVNNGTTSYIDSIKVTILNPASSVLNEIVCQGQSYSGHTTSGTYVDTLIAANGCDSIRTLNLSVLPKSFSTISQSICQGQTYLGHSTSGIHIDTLIAANGCDSIRTLNLSVELQSFSNLNATICKGENYFSYTISGTYIDTLVAFNGCDSIRTIRLLVLDNCEVYFPSAFTPNNDGKNDVFKILNATNLTEYVLSIYNRWGEKVFETTDFKAGWNGIYNGIRQPIGVYVWQSRFNKAGMKKYMKGTVVLIR